MTSPTPVALVTGGTTGIGFATAQELHKRGYAVLVTGNNPTTLAAARDGLPSDAVVLQADSSTMASADTVADELRTRFGRVDAVVLNAGIGRMLPVEAVDEATYDEHFAVNVKGQFFTLQKLLPLIGPGGSIIFTTSVGSHIGAPNWSVYTATKGALMAMVRALAVELATRNIRVNSVSPGPINNAAFAKLGLPPAELDQFKALIPQRIPLGRFGVDEEIARAVAFLSSPDASFITGADIRVDGLPRCRSTVLVCATGALGRGRDVAANRRLAARGRTRGLLASLVEPGPQEGGGRPAEDGEGFVVVQPADVLHDDDGVDPECEGERGLETATLLVGKVLQGLECGVEPTHPPTFANRRWIFDAVATVPEPGVQVHPERATQLVFMREHDRSERVEQEQEPLLDVIRRQAGEQLLDRSDGGRDVGQLDEQRLLGGEVTVGGGPRDPCLDGGLGHGRCAPEVVQLLRGLHDRGPGPRLLIGPWILLTAA